MAPESRPRPRGNRQTATGRVEVPALIRPCFEPGGPMMEAPVVISLGSVNVDFQVRTDHWPRPGETVLATDFLMISGGKAANIAYLCRKLGLGSRLLARLGDDLLADPALEPLQKIGVDLSGVRRVASSATGASLIAVRRDGDKAILLAANANEAWNSDDENAVAESIASSPKGS